MSTRTKKGSTRSSERAGLAGSPKSKSKSTKGSPKSKSKSKSKSTTKGSPKSKSKSGEVFVVLAEFKDFEKGKELEVRLVGVFNNKEKAKKSILNEMKKEGLKFDLSSNGLEALWESEDGYYARRLFIVRSLVK